MTAPPSQPDPPSADTPTPHPSSGFVFQAKNPHQRTWVGIGMMIVGVLFAIPQLLTQILDAVHQNPEAVSPTLLQLARWYGLPALLILSGYNLVSPQGFATLADKARGLLGRGGP